MPRIQPKSEGFCQGGMALAGVPVLGLLNPKSAQFEGQIAFDDGKVRVDLKRHDVCKIECGKRLQSNAVSTITR